MGTQKKLQKMRVPSLFLFLFSEISTEEESDAIRRLSTLGRWQDQWTEIYLGKVKGDHWRTKFRRNTERVQKAYNICGQKDSKAKRNKRSPDVRSEDEKFFNFSGGVRLNHDPLVALRRITFGMGKWARKYVSQCKVQPRKQVNRGKKWFKILTEKHEKYMAKKEKHALKL